MEESQETGFTGLPRQRNPNACDACRAKKVRCDSFQLKGQKCSNCIASGIACTHLRQSKKRGPKIIDEPESGKPGKNTDTHATVLQENATTMPAVLASPTRSTTDTDAQDDSSNDEDDFVHLDITERLKNLSLQPMSDRFFGPSSGFLIMKNVMDLKNACTGTIGMPFLNRSQYWNMHPWEIADAIRSMPVYVFPDDDLLSSLVNIYFEISNPYYPSIHEPTFRHGLVSKLHLQNPQYAATVLLVCAIASRYSKDPRVLVETSEPLSSGWKYYEQIQALRKDLFYAPTLYDLQAYCLSALFLIGTSSPNTSWQMIGLGLRCAEEIGAHRRKPPAKMTAEDEMRKRAFWVLIYLDRINCSFLGRSCALRREDINVEFPAECDDEYWTISRDGLVEFKQPPNKPSFITAFNRQLILCDIMGSALQLLYSSSKSKGREQYEHQVVSELDSRLNSWMDQVPAHLKWDPTREYSVFANQSAVMHMLFHLVQIQIHRPFTQKSSSLSYSAVAVVANAARSLISILERQTTAYVLVPTSLMFSFIAGGVLLLNLWKAQLSGLSVVTARDSMYVRRCMDAIKPFEDRWHVAGRLWDMLNQLSTDTQPTTCAPQPPYSHLFPTSAWMSSPSASTDSSMTFAAPDLSLPAPQVAFTPSDADLYNFIISQSLSSSVSSSDSTMDSEMVDIWNAIPVGFNLEEWGTYLTGSEDGVVEQ